MTDTGYSTCKTYYLSSDEELDIHYYGASLDGECAIKVDSFGTKDMCVKAVSFETANSCQVEVEYFKYTWSSSPEKVSVIRAASQQNLSLGFRKGQTQTGLCSTRRWLKARYFLFSE